MLLLTFPTLAQQRITDYMVQSATTPFTVGLPAGTRVYDSTTKFTWKLNTLAPAGNTLNTTSKMMIFTGWWTGYGANIASNNTGKVGIGITNPTSKLTVTGGGIYAKDSSIVGQGTTVGAVTTYAGIFKAWNKTMSAPFDFIYDTLQGMKSTKYQAFDSFFIWRYTAQTATSRELVWSVQPASDGIGVIHNENSQRAMSSWGTRNRGFGMNALNASSTLTGSDNYGIGHVALTAVTSGFGNKAFGNWALTALTTGKQNIATGDSALLTLTTGIRNYAAGTGALKSTTTSSYNTAIGYFALASNTGQYNTALGYGALNSVTTGSNNIGIGQVSDISTATYNIKIQTESTAGLTTGQGNVVVAAGIGLGRVPKITSGAYNIFLGGEIGGYGSTGVTNSYNIGIGYNLVQNLLTSGGGNIALGQQNQKALTTGNYNISIGSTTLAALTSGSQNFSAGQGALASGTTMSNAIGIGTSAGYNNTADNNIAIGNGALLGNIMNTGLIAIGKDALRGMTVTSATTAVAGNIAIGEGALFTTNPTTVSNGIYNIGIGYQALYSNTTGYYNTVLGYGALRANQAGAQITCIGANSANNTTGANNTLVGYSTAGQLTSGTGNTFLGASSGIYITGSNNVCIGYLAGQSNGASAISNAVVIGYGQIGTQSNQIRMGVAIGTTNPNSYTQDSSNRIIDGFMLQSRLKRAFDNSYYTYQPPVTGGYGTPIFGSGKATFANALGTIAQGDTITTVYFSYKKTGRINLDMVVGLFPVDTVYGSGKIVMNDSIGRFYIKQYRQTPLWVDIEYFYK